MDKIERNRYRAYRMRQPANKEKLRKLYYYYVGLKESFRAGILDGKIGFLMSQKLKELNISLSTWRRYKDNPRKIIK